MGFWRDILSRSKGLPPEGSSVPHKDAREAAGRSLDVDSLPEWSKGREGKGLLLRDGELVTWETQDGWPFHGDVLGHLDPDHMRAPRAYLVIDTDGRTRLQGTQTPEEDWPDIIRQNPQLKLKNVEDYWGNEEFKFGSVAPKLISDIYDSDQEDHGQDERPGRRAIIWNPDREEIWVGSPDSVHWGVAHAGERMHGNEPSNTDVETLMPRHWSYGSYTPHDNRFVWYRNSLVPPEVDTMVREHLGADPNEEAELKFGSVAPARVVYLDSDDSGSLNHGMGHPFVYDPEQNTVYIGRPGDYHSMIDFGEHAIGPSFDGRVDPNNITFYEDPTYEQRQAVIDGLRDARLQESNGEYGWTGKGWEDPYQFAEPQKDWKFGADQSFRVVEAPEESWGRMEGLINRRPFIWHDNIIYLGQPGSTHGGPYNYMKELGINPDEYNSEDIGWGSGSVNTASTAYGPPHSVTGLSDAFGHKKDIPPEVVEALKGHLGIDLTHQEPIRGWRFANSSYKVQEFPYENASQYQADFMQRQPFLYDEDTIYIGGPGMFHGQLAGKIDNESELVGGGSIKHPTDKWHRFEDVYGPFGEGSITPSADYFGGFRQVGMDDEYTNENSYNELPPEVGQAINAHLGTDYPVMTKDPLTNSWKFGSDYNRWNPGERGKGIVYDGNIHTWNVDETGSPHHFQYLAQLEGDSGNYGYEENGGEYNKGFDRWYQESMRRKPFMIDFEGNVNGAAGLYNPAKLDEEDWERLRAMGYNEAGEDRNDWRFGTAHHFNHRGDRCHCPWGSNKPMRRQAGVYLQRLMNQVKRGDKKLQSPEGQAMLADLQKMVDENPQYDQLSQYIAGRWKRGDILHTPGGVEPSRPWQDQQSFSYLYSNPITHEDPRYQRAIQDKNREDYIRQGLTYDRSGQGGEGYYNDEDLNRFRKGYSPQQYMKDNQNTFYFSLNNNELSNWNQWLNADNHPLREGVNYLGKDWHTGRMSERSRAYQDYLDQKNIKERLIPELKNNSAVDYKFNNGWTVNRIMNDAGMYNEGEALDHCIGNSGDGGDGPNYKQMAENGDITAYSLRDPEGWPHATWHTNNNHGGVAEVFARSDRALNPDEQDMYEEWCNANGHNPEPVGNLEDTQTEDAEIQLDPTYDVDTLIRRYEDGGYDEAMEIGRLGENTQVYYDTDFSSVMDDAMENADSMNSLIKHLSQEDQPWIADNLNVAFKNEWDADLPELKDYQNYWDYMDSMPDENPYASPRFKQDPLFDNPSPHDNRHPYHWQTEEVVENGQKWRDFMKTKTEGRGINQRGQVPLVHHIPGFRGEPDEWQPYKDNSTWQWMNERDEKARQQSTASFSPPTRQRR